MDCASIFSLMPLQVKFWKVYILSAAGPNLVPVLPAFCQLLSVDPQLLQPYTFQLIFHGGKLFRTHSFRSKVVLLAERNIMLRDHSECSKWSRKQAQNLILHIFLIIIIIIRCSGMFRDVPECSGMFRDVPCSWFYRRPIKTLINNYLVKERVLYRLNERFVSNITGDILFSTTSECRIGT